MPAPNRIAVYIVAAGALATAVGGVVADLDFTSVAAVLGSLAVLAGVVAKWLTGWQQYENVVLRDQVMQREHERAIETASAVSKPGTGRRLNLPS